MELLLPQLFAVIGGTFAVRFAFPAGRAGWMCALGYGYALGLVFGAAGLYICGIAGYGVRFWPAVAVQGALCVLLAFVMRGSRRRYGNVSGSVAPSTAGSVAKWLAVVFAGLLLFRLVVLGLEATAQPLYPWDAWQQWATKARVWFETGELKRFVSADDWLQISRGTREAVYTDANPDYPPMVPLIQVWSLGPTDAWDDSAIGLTWAMLLAALGVAMAGQLFRATGYWPLALGASYMAVSLPILDTHAALAGYGDLPLAVLYCFAFMSAAAFERRRRTADAMMTIAFVVVLPFFKRPGTAWMLTLLPFALLAVDGPRRMLFTRLLIVAGAVASVALIALQLAKARLDDVLTSLWSVVLNLFAWENWHLLWYIALPILWFALRRKSQKSLHASAATLALGAIFLATAFWGTDRYLSIADVTTLNRALLPYACAMGYFLALLVAPAIERLAIEAPSSRSAEPSAYPSGTP